MKEMTKKDVAKKLISCNGYCDTNDDSYFCFMCPCNGSCGSNLNSDHRKRRVEKCKAYLKSLNPIPESTITEGKNGKIADCLILDDYVKKDLADKKISIAISKSLNGYKIEISGTPYTETVGLIGEKVVQNETTI